MRRFIPEPNAVFINKNEEKSRFDATIRFSSKSYILFMIFIEDKTRAGETKRGRKRAVAFDQARKDTTEWILVWFEKIMAP